MNIHPVFVHFPIAFLTVYSALEILGYFSSVVRRQERLVSVKLFLLLVGSVGAVIALITGGIAEEIIEGSARSYILEVHSPVAGFTTVLYLVIAASYIVRVFDRRGWSSRIVGTNTFLVGILNIKRRLAYFVLDTWMLPLIATLALVGMAITGALGAAIVYGPDIDPFVWWIYHLFWVS